MTLDKITKLLSKIIGVPEDELSGSTALTKENDIELIDLARLVIDIEKRFRISIHDEDVHTFRTLNDIADYVDMRLGE